MASIFRIKINNTPVTIDLSKFIGLNSSNIDWGDGNITSNTYIHTYNNDGLYSIIGNFDNVTKIEDNFSIDNLIKIDLYNFSLLNEIGTNFLNNCSSLESLNLSNNNIIKIKENFLNGCSVLSFIKMPSYFIDFRGWGKNIGIENKLNVYVDHKNYNDFINDTNYSSEDITLIWKEIEYIYNDNITEDYAKNISFKNEIFYKKYIDLNVCTNIKNAITNHTIYVESDIEELVDPDTRRVYKDEELLDKTKFILQYTYYFKKNPNNEESEEYKFIYTRLVRAINRETTENKDILFLENLDDRIFYYMEDSELSDDFSNKNYSIKDNILSINDGEVLKYETNILPYQDYEDPPYFRGYIRFGEVNNENVTNVNYEGDVNTGFDIEIKALGVCKNLIIYDADINETIGRREFIKLNTDKMPEGKIISGDYILIRTSQGQKSAFLERNSERIDILKYIDRSSTWLQINKGFNFFYASADTGVGNGSIYNVKINLIWHELFEGV